MNESALRQLFGYLELPLRRPLLTLVPFVLIVFGSLVFYRMQPSLYESSTLIVVETESAPALLIGKQAVVRTRDSLRVFRQEILSRTRIERIISQYQPYSGSAPLSRLVENMRNSIDVSIRGDAFYVAYAHRDPRIARDVVNGLVSLFVAESNQVREERLEVTREFIDSELTEALRALETKEQELRVLNLKHHGALPSQLAANLSTLQRLQFEKQSLADDLRAAEDRRLVLQRALAAEMGQPQPPELSAQQRGSDRRSVAYMSDPASEELSLGAGTGEDTLPPTGTEGYISLIPAPVSAAREGALRHLERRPNDAARFQNTAEQELHKLHQELATLRSRYTDEHPDVRRQLARIERLTEQLAGTGESPLGAPASGEQALREQLTKTELEIADLRAQRVRLKERLEHYDRLVAMTPQVEEKLAAIKRDYTRLQDRYVNWAGKKASSDMSENLEKQWQGQRFRVVDPADLPDRPVSPVLFKFLAAGIMLGLAAGLGAAGLVELLLDHSIKSASELEALVGQPVLATIPRLRPRRVHGRPLPAPGAVETRG